MVDSAPFTGPAVAMLDIADVPRGLRALDALVKEAPVVVLAAGTVQPGRYLLLFGGDVESTERSFGRALEAAGDGVLDAVLLPWAEERMVPAILRETRQWPAEGDTLGVLQNGTSPTLLRAIDAALKGAQVDLVELRVADGLGGTAIATVWGTTADVEAALEIAHEVSVRGRSDAFCTSIIRNADAEVGRALSNGTGFFGAWRG